MRIVVIEDQPELADFIRGSLESGGYVVSTANSGLIGLRLAQEPGVDLVVLDLGLPDIDGLDLLTRLRRSSNTLPVLILSARSQVEDRVRGLDRGANDYLSKPFALEELHARIRSALRTPNQSTSNVLELSGVRVDLSTRQITSNGKDVALTAREFQLLVFFMRHPAQVLSREQLLQSVWGLNYDPGTKVIEVYVGYLRRKLGLPDIFESVRGAGYRMLDR